MAPEDNQNGMNLQPRNSWNIQILRERKRGRGYGGNCLKIKKKSVRVIMQPWTKLYVNEKKPTNY